MECLREKWSSAKQQCSHRVELIIFMLETSQYHERESHTSPKQAEVLLYPEEKCTRIHEKYGKIVSPL